MAEVVCEQQDFFFLLLLPPPPEARVGVNEAFYVLPCHSLRYMLDMSRFVRN